jgi:membrane fusion protein, multidrug efflux system
MKKLALILVLAAVAALAWIAWFKPAAEEELEADAPTEVAVHVATIERANLRDYVTAYGTVDPAPGGQQPAAAARVAPAVAGVITEVRAVEGQPVAKGDVLFRLDSRAADIAVQSAEVALARQQRLLEIDGTSEKLVQEARQQLDAARVQQSLLSVRAPLAGTVTRVNVSAGEAVDLTTVMAEIVDLDRLVVSVAVPSAELSALAIGQRAEVSASGLAAAVHGTVSFIGGQVDPQTGTTPVRATLPGGSGLRPGQFVTLRIVTAEHADRLAVPIESVVEDDDGASVIAVVDGDTARRTAVQTGLRDGGLIEIAGEGLRAGMTVVTAGAYGLPAETKVRILED